MLRVAFIGAGRMARLHLRALGHVATPHAVVGVYDERSEAARAFAALAGAASAATPAALLDGMRPDVVHVCTPAGLHAGPAAAALEAGAHVYVEKPFVETAAEADRLLDLARERGRLVCAGHQLLRDPSFTALVARASALGSAVQVDSAFAFRAPGLTAADYESEAAAAQLIDVLPHPLYTLVEALELLAPGSAQAKLTVVDASPADLHAVLRAGDATGRLFVSIRARPVTSALAVFTTGGALTADFVRGMLLGAGNPGTEPLEKILNPVLEGGEMAARTVRAVARRLGGGNNYPGLAELIGDFYAAVATGGQSPLTPGHLRRVTRIYQRLSAEVRSSVAAATARRRALRPPGTPSGAPVAVLTGARGFLGRRVAAALHARGFAVRGVGRRPDDAEAGVGSWVKLDLSAPVSPDALEGAEVVVHAAAETSGGFAEHEANSVNATRHLLRAMSTAGVRRLVYVSSLSVVRPPRWRERQDERTPLARNAAPLGAYTWGKVEAERVVAEEAPPLGIETRIVRPAALLDAAAPELPGLAGRRLFGRWHLGFGRPALPFAACEVRQAAEVVAWCAEAFEDAPQVVNLVDPALGTRGDLLRRLRTWGWRGRMVWVPVSLFALLVTAARWAMALPHLQRPAPLAVWSVLRPRRFDTALAARTLAAAAQRAPRHSPYPAAAAQLSGAGSVH